MIRFHDVGFDLFLADFKSKLDKEHFIHGSPWNFDKNIMLLKEYDGKQQMSKLVLTNAPFWIRIHDLPLMGRNTYMGKEIGNSLGQTLEVNLDEGEVEWGEFLRVRVILDISKPLIRKKHIIIEDLEPMWVYFTYEKVPNFCNGRGIIGHTLKECALWKGINDLASEKELPYGPWLKAVLRGNRG